MKKIHQRKKNQTIKDVLSLLAIAILLILTIQFQQPITGNATQVGVWIPISDPNYIDQDAYFSNTPGSSITYDVSGEVTLVTQLREDFGIMEVRIDEQLPRLVDLYSKQEQFNVKHTYNVKSNLKVSVAGTRNPESLGNYVLIDEVIGDSVTSTKHLAESTGNAVKQTEKYKFTFIDRTIPKSEKPTTTILEKLLNWLTK